MVHWPVAKKERNEIAHDIHAETPIYIPFILVYYARMIFCVSKQTNFFCLMFASIFQIPLTALQCQISLLILYLPLWYDSESLWYSEGADLY